jgi:hypothetical protein
MRYEITINRIEEQQPTMNDQGRLEGGPRIVQVYQQSFDELNVAEMITRLNHVPVKRPRKSKAAAK